jgi:hypothetical protein
MYLNHVWKSGIFLFIFQILAINNIKKSLHLYHFNFNFSFQWNSLNKIKASDGSLENLVWVFTIKHTSHNSNASCCCPSSPNSQDTLPQLGLWKILWRPNLGEKKKPIWSSLFSHVLLFSSWFKKIWSLVLTDPVTPILQCTLRITLLTRVITRILSKVRRLGAEKE